MYKVYIKTKNVAALNAISNIWSFFGGGGGYGFSQKYSDTQLYEKRNSG